MPDLGPKVKIGDISGEESGRWWVSVGEECCLMVGINRKLAEDRECSALPSRTLFPRTMLFSLAGTV